MLSLDNKDGPSSRWAKVFICTPLLKGHEMCWIRGWCDNQICLGEWRGIEWPWNFFRIWVDVDQSTAIGSRSASMHWLCAKDTSGHLHQWIQKQITAHCSRQLVSSPGVAALDVNWDSGLPWGWNGILGMRGVRVAMCTYTRLTCDNSRMPHGGMWLTLSHYFFPAWILLAQLHVKEV